MSAVRLRFTCGLASVESVRVVAAASPYVVGDAPHHTTAEPSRTAKAPLVPAHLGMAPENSKAKYLAGALSPHFLLPAKRNFRSNPMSATKTQNSLAEEVMLASEPISRILESWYGELDAEHKEKAQDWLAKGITFAVMIAIPADGWPLPTVVASVSIGRGAWRQECKSARSWPLEKFVEVHKRCCSAVRTPEHVKLNLFVAALGVLAGLPRLATKGGPPALPGRQ